MRISLLIVIPFLATCFAAGQALQMQPLPAQSAIVGQNYTLPLNATGGTPPYTWHVVTGNLPPGLKLHPHAGKIDGTPTTPGEYRVTVVVVDSSIPKFQIQTDVTIHVIAGLTVDWKEPPKVNGSTISGSAVVSNQTTEDFDLTVVIVAVNEIGRATTLGYQHFRLAAGNASPVIPFGSSPGQGTYYVRLDAVAHHPNHHHIYRTSKQTSEPLKLTQ
ncbi:MAG: Ig domain-containing protein [Candidatus Korobacteraceae bacterium]|jgi:putative Ig domain-containing protein